MAIDAEGLLFVTAGRTGRPNPGSCLSGDGSLIGGFGPSGSGEGQLIFPAGSLSTARATCTSRTACRRRAAHEARAPAGFTP